MISGPETNPRRRASQSPNRHKSNRALLTLPRPDSTLASEQSSDAQAEDEFLGSLGYLSGPPQVERFWGGFGVVLGWLWGSLGVALRWLWCGFGVPIGWLSVGLGVALGWLCTPESM